MAELLELYREVVIDHSNRPRNFCKLEHPSHRAEGVNPLCGDRVEIFLTINDGKVQAISFQGSGCAIATASASMMTESVKGKTLAEVEVLFKRFHQMVTGERKDELDVLNLGKLGVFSSVCEFPARVKCATLCWHAMINAVRGHSGSAVTE